ncbi:MAG: RNA pseudouridine synthase [Eubacteriales bacterium]|nr:RNA pseudouridine synthase [Eubacteriales bacterium]
MLKIIYEDKNKIIVDKPAGQLSQSGKSFDMDIVSEVLNYRRSKGEEAYAAIINRLDRPVSGLVLLAKNKKEAARLSELMKSDTFDKRYIALVKGRPEKEKGHFTDFLVKDGKSNMSRVAEEKDKDAKRAELEYELIDYDEVKDVSRVLIHLLTGRHHQIRVQFASRNFPLVGDGKYGLEEASKKAEELGLKRGTIALCSVGLSVDGKMYETEPDF